MKWNLQMVTPIRWGDMGPSASGMDNLSMLELCTFLHPASTLQRNRDHIDVSALMDTSSLKRQEKLVNAL